MFENNQDYGIIFFEMPNFKQHYYCSTCKKYTHKDKQKKCEKCGSSITKTWSVSFKVPCQDHFVIKKLKDFKTKKDAYNAYITYLQSTALQPNLTFDLMLEKYFVNCTLENAESTLYEKRHIFSTYISPYFKNRNLKTLTKSDFLAWQNNLWNKLNPKTAKQYSWRYLNKVRGVLHSFLSFCEEVYDIPNKLRYIKIPKNKDIIKVAKFWELDTFNKFINSVDGILWDTLWSTFMYTGARFSEIRALGDNDVIGNQIIINKSWSDKSNQKLKATKNYKIVTKQIPKVLQKKIEEYKKWKKEQNISSTFLFGGAQPLGESTIRRHLKSDIKKSGVPEISPHGFRHSYVSLLVNLNVSTKVIAELVGDREKQILETYSHLYQSAKNDAINLIDKKLSKMG